MRDYELVTIFKSALAEEEVEKKLDRYHGVVTDGGGEVATVEHWGKQQLSYPIANETNGYYVVSQFTADPGDLEEMERLIKLDEDLLRHLVVLSEGEPATAPSLRGQDEDEDDEDEDEDEDERPRGKREKGEEKSDESAEAGEDEENGADDAGEEAEAVDEAEEEAEEADEAEEEAEAADEAEEEED